MTRIDTIRLFMTKLTDKDAPFILELINSEGWKKFIGERNINTLEEAEAYIKKIADSQNITYWVIYRKADHSAIGIITFIKREHLAHHDIGFALLPQFTGQGYAMEACQPILHIVHKTFSLKSILATVKPENTSSIRLLEKLGFSVDETNGNNTPELNLYIHHFIADR